MTLFPSIKDKLMRPFLYQQKMIAGDNIAIEKTNDGPEISAPQGEIWEAIRSKQDVLTAGDNITIVDDVISATGGGSSLEADYLDYEQSSPSVQGSVHWRDLSFLSHNVEIVSGDWFLSDGFSLQNADIGYLGLGETVYDEDPVSVSLIHWNGTIAAGEGEMLAAGEYTVRPVWADVSISASVELNLAKSAGSAIAVDTLPVPLNISELRLMSAGTSPMADFPIYAAVDLKKVTGSAALYQGDAETVTLSLSVHASGIIDVWGDAANVSHYGSIGSEGFISVGGFNASGMTFFTDALTYFEPGE